MRKLVFLTVFVSLMLTAVNVNAQKKDPRGIYHMVTLIGKQGAIKAPFDQYKICTDSITLMMVINSNGAFMLSNTDKKVFKYTGDKHDDENDKSTLIYDSNSEHFTLKWFNPQRGHLYYPDNDWCTEIYQSDSYSESGKIIFDALTAKKVSDKEVPLIGKWEFIGYMDELNDVENSLNTMIENYSTSKYFNQLYMILTPGYFVGGNNTGGRVSKVRYMKIEDEWHFRLGDNTSCVKWLRDNIIAVEIKEDWRTDYMIYKRIDDKQPMLDRLLHYHVMQQK